jgi:hypothetical protein
LPPCQARADRFGARQQSLSLPAVQPVGQQESRVAPEQAVIGIWRQAALHVSREPTIRSSVHGSPSSGQTDGQVFRGSQSSPAPSFPSPHTGAQSLSLAAPQPAGQQPSLATQAVMGAWLHAREHDSIEPVAWSDVHAFPSSQLRAQAPGMPAVMARSQVSPSLTTPSPQ